MPVMDEFKEEREALKNAPLKDKIKYFWCYYKWHTFAVIVAIAIVISLVNTFLSYKETGFYAAFINTLPAARTSEECAEEFGNLTGIDMKEYQVVFDTNMFIDMDRMDEGTVANTQKMMVYIAAGDLDMVVTDTASLRQYAYQESFVDLTTILTPEQQKKYEPYYYYIDRKLSQEIKQASEDLDNEYVPVYPADPFDPTSMEDPVPVGVCMDSCTKLKNDFRFRDGNVVLSIVTSAKHKELAVQYLEYVFEEPTN